MAERGGQPGNQNAVKSKRWQQAILRALARASSKDVDTGLDSAADKLVALAMDGDKWALEELGDRVDGKPAQAIIGGGEDDPPIRTVSRIELVDLDSGSGRAAPET